MDTLIRLPCSRIQVRSITIAIVAVFFVNQSHKLNECTSRCLPGFVSGSNEITQLLNDVRDGDTEALERLIPLVYDRLRSLAHQQRIRQGANETMNTTAVVHEAYEKLARGNPGFVDRTHFFRVAARAMRDVIVDHARMLGRAKRGGGIRPLELDENLLVPAEQAGQVLALDEALGHLASLDERQAEIVELRYFVGLTIEETSDVLGISPATVKRDWTTARAWLYQYLRDES